MKKNISRLFIVLAGAALVVGGCTDQPTTQNSFTPPPYPTTPAPIVLVGSVSPTAGAPATAAPSMLQVERLARPAVNEGLIISNSNLNLWNSVGPEVDATSAATGIATEAGTVLKALGNGDISDPASRTNTLLKAFVPDVMRIDTTVASGYANKLNTLGAPVAGRLIADDVIDVTLSVLVAPAVASAVPGLTADNVSYTSVDATGRKHQPLQTAFPFLARPN